MPASLSLNNVGSHAKNQPLLGKNEKRPKMSVRTFLPGALQFCFQNEDGDHDHSPVLHNNDYNDIRDYMEGHTLLPTVYNYMMWMQSLVQVPDTEMLFQHQALCKLIQDHVKCKAHHLLLIKTVPNLSLLRVVVPGMKILCLPLFSVKYQRNCLKKAKCKS